MNLSPLVLLYHLISFPCEYLMCFYSRGKTWLPHRGASASFEFESCILPHTQKNNWMASTGFKVSLLVEKQKSHKVEVILYSQWVVSDLCWKECIVHGVKLVIREDRKAETDWEFGSRYKFLYDIPNSKSISRYLSNTWPSLLLISTPLYPCKASSIQLPLRDGN